MRIVYVTETYPPELNGVALTVQRAVQHLRDAGHVVHLVRPRQRGEPACDSADEWRTAGGPIPLYPALRYGFATTMAMRRRLRAVAPALVHVATPGPLAWAALRAAQAEGIAASADFRTNFHAYSRHYGLAWLEPAVLAYLRALHAMAACNFVPTPALATALARHGFRHVQVVGRGVDAGRFTPAARSVALRRSWGVADAGPVLLHVGRLAPEKNVGMALAAYRRLRADRPALRMVVVGDGPLRRRLQAAYPEVVFAGPQSGVALAEHYASADVFLFPSLTETFGNVVLEALASGLALAAFGNAAAALHTVDGRSACLAPVAAGDAAETSNAALFTAAAARALDNATADSPMRQAARTAALCADWDVQLRAFDQAPSVNGGCCRQPAFAACRAGLTPAASAASTWTGVGRWPCTATPRGPGCCGFWCRAAALPTARCGWHWCC